MDDLTYLSKQRPFLEWGESHELFCSHDKEDDYCLGYFNEGYVGCVVDIGAADLCTGSNSFKLLYERGWKGICVDPFKEMYDFSTKVIQTLNLDVKNYHGAVVSDDYSEETIPINFYFDRPGHSGINKLPWLEPNGRVDNVRSIKIKELLSGVDHIDVLTIDTEGFDSTILESVFSMGIEPTIVIIESDCSIFHPASIVHPLAHIAEKYSHTKNTQYRFFDG